MAHAPGHDGYILNCAGEFKMEIPELNRAGKFKMEIPVLETRTPIEKGDRHGH